VESRIGFLELFLKKKLPAVKQKNTEKMKGEIFKKRGEVKKIQEKREREAIQEKINESKEIDVSEILPELSKKRSEVKIRLPEEVFDPRDPWTKVFADGLRKIDKEKIKNKNVWEIGVGSGVIAILLKELGAKRVIGSDINRIAALTAKRNVEKLLGKEALKDFEFVVGDLFSFIKSLKNIELVVACLPQIPVPFEVKEREAADYYFKEKYPSDLNIVGLGLIDNFLAQIREQRLLPKNGSIVLNLGGRPSKETLLKLFKKYDFHPQVVNEEIVPQDPNTSLSSLAKTEQKSPIRFEFFEDPQGKNKISATQAEERRKKGESVFHKIYVISATPR